MNVAVVGNVDHGKSTLIGRLLYDSGNIPDNKLSEVQKVVNEYKKKFEFAYFLDAFSDEVSEERTIDTTEVTFMSDKRLYTMTDVPGHKEFIKNMLTGASHSDVAIIVIAIDEGIQEQTRRHAFLINMLGISNVIVVINKMDLVNYEAKSFWDITVQVAQSFSQFDYEVSFIPISAFEGQNVYKKSEKMSWFPGISLVEALDSTELSDSTKPFRFAVQGLYPRGSGKIIVGRVESGSVSIRDKVVFMPSNQTSRVKGIWKHQERLVQASEGDSIGLVTSSRPKRGEVCGLSDTSPIVVNKFLGEVVLLDGALEEGEHLYLKCGPQEVRCKVFEIVVTLNSETGEASSFGSSNKIVSPEAGIVWFKTDPLVLEKFSEVPELGRFVLVRYSKAIGAGIVLEKGG